MIPSQTLIPIILETNLSDWPSENIPCVTRWQGHCRSTSLWTPDAYPGGSAEILAQGFPAEIPRGYPGDSQNCILSCCIRVSSITNVIFQNSQPYTSWCVMSGEKQYLIWVMCCNWGELITHDEPISHVASASAWGGSWVSTSCNSCV